MEPLMRILRAGDARSAARAARAPRVLGCRRRVARRDVGATSLPAVDTLARGVHARAQRA